MRSTDARAHVVGCRACLDYARAERDALRGNELPVHTLDGCTCSDSQIAITYLTPERFEASRQIGIPISQEWSGLRHWLCTPSFASHKRAAGAWCPTALESGVVKGGSGPVSLLVADVDDVTEGGVDRSMNILESFEGAIVPTFSATPTTPKHRIVLTLTRPLEPMSEFPIAWTKMARRLGAAGIIVDKGCKNRNRLYFACVSRSPEAWRELGGARIISGSPIDVDRMLLAARRDAEAEQREREERARAQNPIGHPDAYVAGAIRKARDAVASASEGGRHDALLREAFGLARFGLTESQLNEALLEAFVAKAGEARRREGQRAIRDAVEARKGAA